MVRLAGRAVERGRARGLVLVAEAAGPGAHRPERLGRFSSRPEPGVPRAGPRTGSEHDPAARGRYQARHIHSGEAPRRQHARPQPRGDRLDGAVDVGRAPARPRGRAVECPSSLLRSGSQARRRAGGRGRARLGTVRLPHRGDAHQPQPVAASNGHRAGRRVRRASAGQRDQRRSGRRRSAHRS